MTERDLERKLAQALDHAAPNDLQEVLSQCGPRERTVIEMTEITNTNRKSTNRKNRWRPLIAAVLALALIGGGGGGLFYHNAHAVASVVSLDVNPSIELKVNRAEKVLSCTPMNEDAAVILFDMGGGDDLVGTKLDVAVNAVVGSLLRNGYLEGLSSAILVSVEDDDQTRAQRIQEEVVAAVDSILQGANNTSSVYSQTLTTNDTAALNNQAPISSGKAALVQQVMDMNGAAESARSTLAALSVEELMDLLETRETRIPIGMDAAARNAQEYAGTRLLSSNVVQDVDPELDDPTPHYEVELAANGREYDYRVDAFTGAVLSGQKDILSAAPANPGTQTGTGTQSSGAQTGTQTPAAGTQTGTGAQIGTQAPAANPQTPSTQTADVGADAAKAAALKHAGLSYSQVTWAKVERDYDDGRLEYDVEFRTADTEYDYTVLASDGSILKHETEAIRQPSSGSSQGSGNGQSSGQTQQKPTQTADVGADAAKSAALKHAGLSSGQVTWIKAERDYDDGRLEYELEFRTDTTEYEYTVLASDGSILKHETEAIRQPSSGNSQGSGSSQAQQKPAQSGDIGLEAAKSAALKHAGLSSSQVTGLKAEKDRDDGRLEYEVEFKAGGYEYEYKIDGTNGAILEHDKDLDD